MKSINIKKVNKCQKGVVYNLFRFTPADNDDDDDYFNRYWYSINKRIKTAQIFFNRIYGSTEIYKINNDNSFKNNFFLQIKN